MELHLCITTEWTGAWSSVIAAGSEGSVFLLMTKSLLVHMACRIQVNMASKQPQISVPIASELHTETGQIAYGILHYNIEKSVDSMPKVTGRSVLELG